MENNNRGFENSNPESTQGRESNNNGRQAPLGFEGMNFEQKRGRYGVQSTENSRGNNNERTNNSENRQEQ